MLEAIIFSIIGAFVARTLARMVYFCLSYGQVFGQVKLWVARQIDSEVDKNFCFDKQSENEEKSIEIYDMLCEVKYKDFPPAERRWSYLISLMDCEYCIGFWISIIAAIIGFITGYNAIVFILFPTLTFFFTEKI